MYTSSLNAELHSGTPMVIATDARGLIVREMGLHRDTVGTSPDLRIVRHQHNARGLRVQSIDPRLFDNGVKANSVLYYDLMGNPIRSDSVDSGTVITLLDAAGRNFIVRNAINTLSYWQYEDSTLPGRPLTVTEQSTDASNNVTARFVYAPADEANKARNRAGLPFISLDTAGIHRLQSVALSGVVLATSLQLLKDAEAPDWSNETESAWQAKCEEIVYSTSATADSMGASLTQTNALGYTKCTHYDIAGLAQDASLILPDGTEYTTTESVKYSAAGQVQQEVHGNGVTTTYEHDPATLRVIGIRIERPTGHPAGQKVMQYLRYEYDPVGNVVEVQDTAQATRHWRNQKVVPGNNFAYDTLYQLISASGREMANAAESAAHLPSPTIPIPADDGAYTNYTCRYNYDRGGNLTQISHIAPATNNNYTTHIVVSNRSNRAVPSDLETDPGKIDELFDSSGHQLQLIRGQSLDWTSKGQLRSVSPVRRDGQPDDKESYRYGSDHMRVLKLSEQQTGSSTQVWRVIYLPGLEIRTRHNAGTLKETLHVVSVGKAGQGQVKLLHWTTAPPEGMNNDQLRYSYDNLIGSSGLEVDGNAALISQEEYYPYGGTAVWASRSQTEADYKTIRYSSKERDATGLYYYGFRYYQPWSGRWLSADPAGAVDGLNLFQMVNNNPTTFHDGAGLLKVGDAARDATAQAFIHPLHMPVFEQLSIDKGLIISVREAGIYTINALGAGAAAKGHNILEKTIKADSLKPVYGDRTDSILALAIARGFVGQVGAWNKSGVYGIHAHNNISSDDRIFPINLQSSRDNELVNAWTNLKIITPYTGDYDMHDIIIKGPGGGTIPEVGSLDERGVKDDINSGVAARDSARPFEKESMNVVRHGPQVNYVPYMWKFEKDKVKADNGYPGTVANPGAYPIAAVNDGQWSILESESDLFNLYDQNKTPLPEHWKHPMLDRKNGKVATAMHAKILDRHNNRNRKRA